MLSTKQAGVRRAMAAATLIAASCALFPLEVRALSFVPTEVEWRSWPDYCQARYTVSGSGSDSQYATAVSPQKVREWESKLAAVWYGLHHYCAGVIFLQRGAAKKQPAARKSDFKEAAVQATYTLNRSSSSHPMYSTMLAMRGRALYELGETDKAFADLEEAMRLHPEVPDAYAAAGYYYRKMGKLDLARDTMTRGVEASHGGTAELRYLLGLVLFELKDFNGSVEHAKAAYAMGYPLPGLRRKLEAGGHWPK